MLIDRITLKLYYSWNLLNSFDFSLNNDSEKQLSCANVQVLINCIQIKIKSVLLYETCVRIFFKLRIFVRKYKNNYVQEL